MQIYLEDFEGPLDLLLHLIKKNKMDILDIKIEVIIDQYIDYINNMQSLNLDIAASYLVMASDLMLIKSKKLLPGEDEEIEEEINLIDSLVEYQKYKEQVEKFKSYEEYRNNKISKKLENFEAKRDVLKDDKERLFNALQKLIEDTKDRKPQTLDKHLPRVSVKNRENFIMEKLAEYKKVKFNDLFENTDKDYIIASFLAMLNLCKKKKMLVKQDELFDDIYCEVRDGK